MSDDNHNLINFPSGAVPASQTTSLVERVVHEPLRRFASVSRAVAACRRDLEMPLEGRHWADARPRC